jgi:hypothetical protein
MMPLAVLALALAVESAQPATIRAESERYTVEALDAGGADRPARVIVSDNVTSRRHMVMVNSTMGELRKAAIRDDQQRVTLVCSKGFAVVDPAGVANTDEVYGLDAVLSPGARWIAYRRFYPATHPGPSDGIVLYDTRQSREENHGAYPIAAEREWRAGWAIYPPAAEWKDANAVHGAREGYVLTSPIAWEGQRTAPVLLFSMRHGDEDAVVLAELGGQTARTCASPLPGPADRWRVKTLAYERRPGGEHVVHAASSALDQKLETTITAAGGSCRDGAPQR